ncbi:MAG: DUF6477 family protein [Paracoccaceae bacterium]
MSRPRILITTAQYGAQRYRRRRDLPGAIAGLLSRSEDQIIPRLTEAEKECEDARVTRSASYRPGKHVQILAALMAEQAAVQGAPQANASGSDAFRSAM